MLEFSKVSDFKKINLVSFYFILFYLYYLFIFSFYPKLVKGWWYNIKSSLLSLLPPSYMIVPERELANTLNTSFSQSQSHQQNHSTQSSIKCEIILFREEFFSSSPSIDSKRDMSINSSMLWLMPPGDNMEKGKGYDDTISCATSSLSQHLM